MTRAGLLAVVLLASCQSKPPLVDLVVEATWAGASASQVEQGVLVPVERALAGVPGVQQLVCIADDNRATVYVRIQAPGARLAEVKSQQAVLEAMLALDSLPEEVQTPTAFVLRPRRTWLRAGADDEAVRRAQGALAQKGIGASASVVASAASEWTLMPELLRARSVAPGTVVAAVDRALALQAFRGAATPVSEGVTLGDVAQPRAQSHAPAFVDGAPAVALSVEGKMSVEGWIRADSAESEGAETCLRVLAGPTGAPPGSGRWVREGSMLTGRVPSGAPPVPGAVSWDCALPVQRVALVPTEDAADLSVARDALASWSGAAAVIDVPAPASASPAITVQVDAAKAAAFGLSASQVSQQLSFWGQPRRSDGVNPSAGGSAGGLSGVASDGLITLMSDPTAVVLHAPERAEELRAWPLVSADGVWVPLDTLAGLRVAPPPVPLTRVLGRRARIVDVVLAEGAALSDWSAPADIQVVPLDDLGPPRVWR